MSKSEAYRQTIKAVINTNLMTNDEKVGVLELLFDQYKLERYREEKEAKQND